MQNEEVLLMQQITRITMEHDMILNTLFQEKNKRSNDNHNDAHEWGQELLRIKTIDEKAELRINETDSGSISSKIRKGRSTSKGTEPAIYMEQNDETRTCQNMNGVLGNHCYKLFSFKLLIIMSYKY